MRGGGVGKIGGRGAGGDDSYNMQICTLIDHGGRCHPMATMGPMDNFPGCPLLESTSDYGKCNI